MAGQQRDVAETSPAQHAACGYRTRPVTAVDDEGIFDFGGNGRADDRPERDVDRAGDVACTELTPRAYVDDHGRRLRVNQLEQPLRRDRWVTRHGAFGAYLGRNAWTISSSCGKRPAEYFENISLPFTATSKTPRSPRVSSASMPISFLIVAARLEALDR